MKLKLLFRRLNALVGILFAELSSPARKAAAMLCKALSNQSAR